MRKINIIVGFIFMLFSSIIYFTANNFKQTMLSDADLGADFFPKLLAVCTFSLAVMLIITSIKKEKADGDNKISEIFNSNIKNPLGGMILVIAYAVSIPIIGYLVSTMFFCFIFLSLFKVENNVKKTIITVVFSGVLYFMFTNLFLINLPSGLLI